MNKLQVKQELEAKYKHSKARLKRIECVYIPVADSIKAKEFFMSLGLITLSPNGNVKLDSGQGIFFLETQERIPLTFITDDWDDQNEKYEMEFICFEVSEIETLHKDMMKKGVRVSELKGKGGCGLGFWFYDPDGNKYSVWQD